MIKIIFICEGPSERNLVNLVLKKYWQEKGLLIDSETILLGKSGGDVTFKRLEDDLANLLQNNETSYDTSIFDFYQLHGIWPGQELIRDNMTSIEKVTIIEQETQPSHRNNADLFCPRKTRKSKWRQAPLR